MLLYIVKISKESFSLFENLQMLYSISNVYLTCAKYARGLAHLFFIIKYALYLVYSIQKFKTCMESKLSGHPSIIHYSSTRLFLMAIPDKILPQINPI